MAEYIERKAFKNNLMTAMINKTADGDVLAMVLGILMCNLADCEPAADVAPVVHGKWIDNGIPESMLSECSVCGFPCGACTAKYCPKCGAKMDGGKK